MATDNRQKNTVNGVDGVVFHSPDDAIVEQIRERELATVGKKKIEEEFKEFYY